MDRRHFIKHSSFMLLAATRTNIARTGTLNPGNMKYRRLGRTGLDISEISLGGSPVPPEAVFRRALEMGVNYVDTSSSYMNGNSERMIGRMLKAFPDRFFIATKIHAGREGMSIQELEKEFSGSLERLGVEQVDILLVHGARSADILSDEGVLNLFALLKRQGRIRFSGVSCHSNPLEILAPAIKAGHFDMVTVAYNAFSGNNVNRNGTYPDYLRKSGIEAVIELAQKHDVGVIAMKSMAGGDRQDLSRYRTQGASLPQAKLKWVLENEHVTSVLSEMLTFDILEENLAVSGQPFTEKEKKILVQHCENRGHLTCRLCGVCAKRCPAGVAIPDILRYRRYYREHGKKELARSKYQALPSTRSGANCSGCSTCVTVCPHGLIVSELVQQTHRLLS